MAASSRCGSGLLAPIAARHDSIRASSSARSAGSCASALMLFSDLSRCRRSAVVCGSCGAAGERGGSV
eukprot:6519804-Lingulodinium_polyedra.AAC.1